MLHMCSWLNAYLYSSMNRGYKVNEKIIVYGRVNGIYFSGCYIFNGYKVVVFKIGRIEVVVNVCSQKIQLSNLWFYNPLVSQVMFS